MGSRSSVVLLLALTVAAVLLPIVAQMSGFPALVALATRIAIYAILACSLNLILGYGGMVSFGHAAFFGLGGYTIGILNAHMADSSLIFGFIPGANQLIVTLPAAMLVGALAAAPIGALALRTSGVQFIMITLAFAQMLFFLFVGLKGYGGDDGLTIRRRNLLAPLNTRDDATFYYLVLVCLAFYVFILWRIVGSRFGQVLSAARQNERRLAAIGLSPYRYKLAAFMTAGAGAGLAGALMANYARFVSPDMMHWTKSGEIIIMVVLGGMGTLLGPILGAAILVGLEETMAAYTQHWQLFVGIILLTLVLAPRDSLRRVWQLAVGRR